MGSTLLVVRAGALVARRVRQSPWLSWVLPALVFVTVQVYLASNVTTIEYDEAIFLNIAANVGDGSGLVRSLSGEVFFLEHTPLYPLLLGGIAAAFGSSVAMFRSISAVAGLAGVMLVYSGVAHRASPFAGTVAALLVALSPIWTIFSYIIYMEIFMASAIVCGAYFLGRDLSCMKNWWYAGLATAVAVMFKELALVFLGVAGVFALSLPGSGRLRLARGFAIGAPTTLALVVWLLWANSVAPERLRDVLGRWTGSMSGSAESVRTGVSQSDWTGVVAITVCGLALLLMFGVGSILLATRPDRRSPFALLLGSYVVAAVGASFLISLKEPRHLIAVVPVAAMFVGVVIDWDAVIRAAAANRLRMVTGVAVAAGVVALVIPTRLGGSVGAEPAGWNHVEWETRLNAEPAIYSEYSEVGQFLNRTMDRSETVAVVRAGPVVAYYAQREYNILYYAELDGILSSIDSAEFVVEDGSTFRNVSPEQTAALMSKLDREFTVAARFETDTRPILVHQRR